MSSPVTSSGDEHGKGNEDVAVEGAQSRGSWNEDAARGIDRLCRSQAFVDEGHARQYDESHYEDPLSARFSVISQGSLTFFSVG